MRRRLRPVAGVVEAFGKALADFFLPARCVVCGRTLSRAEQYICCHCEADMPLTRYWLREKQPMAQRYNEALLRLLGEAEPSARAAALFFYREEAGYKGIPQALKYEGRRALGRYFGARLGGELARSPLFADVDLIVPVPLHPWRRFRRGYNQAETLSQAVRDAYAAFREELRPPTGAAASEAPVVDGRLLRRVRATQTQTRLSGEEKLKNVAGAFRVDLRALARLPFAPKHILIVDDVFTSGSTLSSAHAALRTVFSPDTRISAAALAFVPDA